MSRDEINNLLKKNLIFLNINVDFYLNVLSSQITTLLCTQFVYVYRNSLTDVMFSAIFQ